MVRWYLVVLFLLTSLTFAGCAVTPPPPPPAPVSFDKADPCRMLTDQERMKLGLSPGVSDHPDEITSFCLWGLADIFNGPNTQNPLDSVTITLLHESVDILAAAKQARLPAVGSTRAGFNGWPPPC
jgi:hypothetical protein